MTAAVDHDDLAAQTADLVGRLTDTVASAPAPATPGNGVEPTGIAENVLGAVERAASVLRPEMQAQLRRGWEYRSRSYPPITGVQSPNDQDGAQVTQRPPIEFPSYEDRLETRYTKRAIHMYRVQAEQYLLSHFRDEFYHVLQLMKREYDFEERLVGYRSPTAKAIIPVPAALAMCILENANRIPRGYGIASLVESLK